MKSEIVHLPLQNLRYLTPINCYNLSIFVWNSTMLWQWSKLPCRNGLTAALGNHYFFTTRLISALFSLKLEPNFSFFANSRIFCSKRPSRCRWRRYHFFDDKINVDLKNKKFQFFKLIGFTFERNEIWKKLKYLI